MQLLRRKTKAPKADANGQTKATVVAQSSRSFESSTAITTTQAPLKSVGQVPYRSGTDVGPVTKLTEISETKTKDTNSGPAPPDTSVVGKATELPYPPNPESKARVVTRAGARSTRSIPETITSTDKPRDFPDPNAGVVSSGHAIHSTHPTAETQTGTNAVTTPSDALHLKSSVTPNRATPDATHAAKVTSSHQASLSAPIPQDNQVPNVLVFGETGTGKSSLINMIAGSDIAGVSGDALGYTFGSKAYEVSIDGTIVRLWDTAGLNEGEHGTVPAENAMQNLQGLVHKLKGGVSLLVYCVRGTRFRNIMQVNYDLFYGIICQKQVPVVIVVTGLENESPMESWWAENGGELESHGMKFAGHACVTMIRGKQLKSGDYMFEEEFEESEKSTRALVKDYYLRTPWIMDERIWLADITSRLAGYYDAQRYGESLEENGRNYSPNGGEGANILLWKFAGFLVRGWEYLMYGPRSPRQFDTIGAHERTQDERRM